MRILMGKYLPLAVLLPLFLFLSGNIYLHGADSEKTNLTYSCGFNSEGYFYYLSQQSVFIDKKTVWFIVPVTFPAKEISREITFCRFNPALKKIEKLATVSTDRNVPVNIRYTFFRKSGKLIVFAFLQRDRKDREGRSALELYLWNGQKSALIGVTGKKERKYYEAYFSDLSFPLKTGPGHLSSDELTNLLSGSPSGK